MKTCQPDDTLQWLIDKSVRDIDEIKPGVEFYHSDGFGLIEIIGVPYNVNTFIFVDCIVKKRVDVNFNGATDFSLGDANVIENSYINHRLFRNEKGMNGYLRYIETNGCVDCVYVSPTSSGDSNEK